MKHLLAALLALVASGSRTDTIAQARADAMLEDYTGDWHGVLEAAGTTLPLILHVDADARTPVTLDSPVQGAFDMAATETLGSAVRDGVLTVGWPTIGAIYTGRLSADGDAIDGRFTQAGTTFPLDFTRVVETDLASPSRPQEPVPPLPYDERTVDIPVPGTDVVLAGTLTLPEREGPFPGVVLISGSGRQDRDERVAGHRPFRVLSDRLARAGIAVLRHDDRGVGESSGTFDGATSRDFAADAAAALGFLATRPETGAVGFVGHSEGGLIAPLAIVERDAEADFVIALAAPFVPMRDIIARQVDDSLRLAGATESVRARSVEVQNGILDAALSDGDEEAVCRAVDAATAMLSEPQRREAEAFCRPWLRTILRLEPAALHREANVPTLALFGSLDVQVAAGPNAEAARVLPRVEARVVDGANHLFQGATSGAVAEYATIEETMREDVMADVAAWIGEHR